MSPAEYRSCIAKLGLSQNAAARFLGVSIISSKRWARLDGEYRPPAPVALLLRFLVARGGDEEMPSFVLWAIQNEYRFREPRRK